MRIQERGEKRWGQTEMHRKERETCHRGPIDNGVHSVHSGITVGNEEEWGNDNLSCIDVVFLSAVPPADTLPKRIK